MEGEETPGVTLISQGAEAVNYISMLLVGSLDSSTTL